MSVDPTTWVRSESIALVDVGGEAFYGVGDNRIQIVSSASAP